MKPVGTLSLAFAAAVVGYMVSAADPVPSADSNPTTMVKVRVATKLLGMTLVDPTGQEIKLYQMESPLPLVAHDEDPAFFYKRTAPTQGCAFWIVEPPANSFLFNPRPNVGMRYPTTVRELVRAIVACTVTPEEYQKIWERNSQGAREYAESLQNKPEERERFLRIADSKMSQEEAGKYICRVVYRYPGRRGTMTTHIHMSRQDWEKLLALLKK
jgi:hypothetical protein